MKGRTHQEDDLISISKRYPTCIISAMSDNYYVEYKNGKRVGESR